MTIPKSWYLLSFLILCLGQWYILGGWIIDSEKTAAQGTFIKIPCMQVDPIDPFRGTYLQIHPQPAQFEFEDSVMYLAGDEIWVHYACLENNVCTFQFVSKNQTSSDHLQAILCKVTYVYRSHQDSSNLPGKFIGTIQYPFTRYYVQENAAIKLTEQYNAALRDTSLKVYAGLYVLGGKVHLEGLWVGDQKLE